MKLVNDVIVLHLPKFSLRLHARVVMIEMKGVLYLLVLVGG